MAYNRGTLNFILEIGVIYFVFLQEMLKLMIGTAIDHSIALTCFFLALNMEAWLLLGYGVPHGTTAYVLVREYDRNNVPIHYIYDSTTALKYNLTDPLCPLQKVICVVNDTNVCFGMLS